VIKTTRRRRLVRIHHRVVFGTFEAVQQVLTACGWQINTAFVERLNLNLRQHVAAIGRRVSTLSNLYSALCTEGSVCSGRSMAFAVYRHCAPVCATAAMDMGSPRVALNRADDELGVTR
jgi:hypothetical protein